MKFREAAFASVACLWPFAAPAAVTVEIISEAGPHGTAPREWLQRLDAAGAGSTRLINRGTPRPRIEELGDGPGGRPLVKVYGVLTRRGELLLPAAQGVERFARRDRQRLAEYFERLEAEGAKGVTTPRGKFGLSEAEFVDLFTRLQTPQPTLANEATLGDLVETAARVARVRIDVHPTARSAMERTAEDAGVWRQVALGSALAAQLRAEGLAIKPVRDVGQPTRLVVRASAKEIDSWPVGYEPEVLGADAAPALFDYLTVEVDGYTLDEAIQAIVPRLKWKERQFVVAYDRFALRRDAIDPAAVEVLFPRRKTYYKRLLENLAGQAKLGVELRVDENGAPFLWLTR